MSRALSSFSAIDGAVVVSKRFEILAFGVEIAPPPREEPMRVRRALDADGDQTVDDDEEDPAGRGDADAGPRVAPAL